jgi:hypothetical protein
METSHHRGDEGRSSLPPADYFTSGPSLPRPGVDDRPIAAYDLAHFERRPQLTLLTVLITVAILATILTLVMGLWTMVYGAEDGPFDSEHWMTYRVILQVVTVLALGATYFVSR